MNKILETKPKFPALNNEYFLLRHGESFANREGIIISDLETGTKSYGLTGQGMDHIIHSAINTRLDNNTIIYSSDFLRAKETAETFASIIDAKLMTLTPVLRERYFGEWEGTATSNYQTIWTADELNNHAENTTVESVYSVASRTMEFIHYLEDTHKHEKILLVSHGDILQILMTVSVGSCPSLHRLITPIKTGEIRVLNSNQLGQFNPKLSSSVITEKEIA